MIERKTNPLDLLLIPSLVGIYLTSRYSYLLFHTLAEMYSIIIAFTIFAILWNSRRYIDNSYLLFIGIAYLFVGVLDMFHTLSYKGLGIFTEYDVNLPTQFWIAARYLESMSLLAAALYIGRKLKVAIIFIIYTAIISLLFLSIFYWQIFPDCFIEGSGLTPFKIVSEYIISLILVATVALLWKKRSEFESYILKLIIASIILTIGAELSFTFYVSVYGISNLIGHYFKILSFYCIYKAIVEIGVRQPFDLFLRNNKLEGKRELEKSEAKLKAFIDGSGDAMAIRDRERRLLLWNSAFAQSIKINCGVDIHVGMRAEDYVPADILLKFKQQREQLNLTFTGKPQNVEFELPGLDGNMVYLETSWTPIWEGDKVSSVAEITRNITERKNTEIELKQSVERYEAFVKNSAEAIWCINLNHPISISLPEDKQVDMIFDHAYFLEVNETYARMLGFESPDELVGRYLREVMPRSIPENLETLKYYVKEKYNVIDLQSIEVTRQGERRTFLNNVQGVIEDGFLIRAWGTERDITTQRKIEQDLDQSKSELQRLAGLLITHQEDELRRLSRELHDDLTQKLAVMAIDAGNIIERYKDLPSSVLEDVSYLKDSLIKTSKDVHNISRELHPSILQDLGLVRAIESECRTFSSRTGIAVVFKPENVPGKMPENISLNIYRIIQEALSNIAKYGKTKNAYIFLEGTDHQITLSVRDTGVGFDTMQGGCMLGLGLGSMRERARLVNGTIEITSESGKGTNIELIIPFKKDMK